ncbi:MAG: hypothetical protein KKG21_07075 [Candidatus Omnitrophica bacterium]|nr:hypothetical protein [Candidatus Omnitrophota bacterium]
MDREVTIAPNEIKHALDFKDKDGYIYHLSPTTYKHIKRDHAIDNPVLFIKDVLLDPDVIVEDKTSRDRWIYHKDYKKCLYKVVVVALIDRKIKTAFISDEVKGGKVQWIKKGPLIK